MYPSFVTPCCIGLIAIGTLAAQPSETAAARLSARDLPSVFQAWNPIDMPAYPQQRLEDRLRAAAKHDVLWEEPVSQLGFGTELVLGAVWDGPHAGLSAQFTEESARQALANRAAMLEINPAMVFLLEVRWRDAPGSFLPDESPFWKRNADGSRVLGWDNGPEPYFLLNPDNPEFQENIARQCRLAIGSGIYDGVMLDWSGHHEIVRRTRDTIGPEPLIIVNIHDDIEDAELYRELINGSFMECNPDGPGCATKSNRGTWDKLRAGYLYMEKHLREPRINCLEVWGNRDDHRRMRAATTLALTHGNGSVLFGDPNPLPQPDHMHDWYAFWDVPLGRPTGHRRDRSDGLAEREFAGGIVFYNHLGNGTQRIVFKQTMRRVSTGESGTAFWLDDADGEIFVRWEGPARQ
jgi:hypothetical protein